MACSWLDELAKNCPARLEFMLQPQHWHGDRARFRAGQAHHADSSTPRRRGDRNNGVINIHLVIR
jgi:hypothetical protein